MGRGRHDLSVARCVARCGGEGLRLDLCPPSLVTPSAARAGFSQITLAARSVLVSVLSWIDLNKICIVGNVHYFTLLKECEQFDIIASRTSIST